MIIEGMDFSGFPGRDASRLRQLSYEGKVEWFRFRFTLVFLTPFRRLIALEGEDCYVWLCVMDLAGSAIQALANLSIGRGSDHAKFTAFVERYMPAFLNTGVRLHDPHPDRNGAATSPADHLYKFFRGGLARTFCIDWGGLQHREEVPTAGPECWFITTPGLGGEQALAIIPREFVRDFERGCEEVLAAFSQAQPHDSVRSAFERTFERVFLLKGRPPLP